MSFPGLVADLVCPLLGAGAAASPFVRPRRGALAAWARTAASLGWVYGLGLLDRRLGWWPALGLDYSTHTGVAVALAVALGARRKPAWPVLTALLVAYAALMVLLRYHTPADIATTALAVAPVAVALHAAPSGPARTAM